MDPVTIWAAPQKVTMGPRWAGSVSSLVIDSILGERSKGSRTPRGRASLAQIRNTAYTQDGERHIAGLTHKAGSLSLRRVHVRRPDCSSRPGTDRTASRNGPGVTPRNQLVQLHRSPSSVRRLAEAQTR